LSASNPDPNSKDQHPQTCEQRPQSRPIGRGPDERASMPSGAAPLRSHSVTLSPKFHECNFPGGRPTRFQANNGLFGYPNSAMSLSFHVPSKAGACGP
jgi:hypothetical protein